MACLTSPGGHLGPRAGIDLRERAAVTRELNTASPVRGGNVSPLPATTVYTSRSRKTILCSEQVNGSPGSGGSGSRICTLRKTSCSRLNSATDGIRHRNSSLSVLCVPPNLSDSIYLLSQDPLSFTGKFCSGKGYETYSP